MEVVSIPARDGLELVGYLTRAVEKGGPPTPLILLVHGGPWARDYWGFNTQAQWFANRGYATLQVNFRGSTGYGKTFLHKGDKQWGVGDMQHDLTDSVEWAIREGIADKDNICSKSLIVLHSRVLSFANILIIYALSSSQGRQLWGLRLSGRTNIHS